VTGLQKPRPLKTDVDAKTAADLIMAVWAQGKHTVETEDIVGYLTTLSQDSERKWILDGISAKDGFNAKDYAFWQREVVRWKVMTGGFYHQEQY
jgi:hypothetical protein